MNASSEALQYTIQCVMQLPRALEKTGVMGYAKRESSRPLRSPIQRGVFIRAIHVRERERPGRV
jgi:hypothetical protein